MRDAFAIKKGLNPSNYAIFADPAPALNCLCKQYVIARTGGTESVTMGFRTSGPCSLICWIHTMLLTVLALIAGIFFLAISADKFVEGASITARELGIPPLLVGMLVIGFGSSMPELVVSVIAARDGNSGLALGNAFGSNVSNIGLILGVTALILPLSVRSSVLTRELPILILVTMLATLLLGLDGVLGRGDGWILIAMFVLVMCWSIYAGLTTKNDELADEVEHSMQDHIPFRRAVFYMIAGLIVLVLSSRLLVWGGVSLAHILGISDLIIVTLEREMIIRDIPILIAFTLLLFVCSYSPSGEKPRIDRKDAFAFITCYLAYNAFLITRIAQG
jgi:Ca2+/Na+ antiporter